MLSEFQLALVQQQMDGKIYEKKIVKNAQPAIQKRVNNRRELDRIECDKREHQLEKKN